MKYKKGVTITRNSVYTLSGVAARACAQIKYVEPKLKKNDKVMFDINCTYSQKLFKQSFPNIIITSDPNEADYMIFRRSGKHISMDSYTGFIVRKTQRDHWGSYTQVEDSVKIGCSTLENRQAMSRLVTQMNAADRRIEYIKLGKPVIDQGSLTYKSVTDRKATKEELDKFVEMLQSPEASMRRLGTMMLLTFDFEKNKKEFAILLLSCKRRISLPNIENVRTFKEKMRHEYPNLKI